jgi:hypothetical protein
MVKLFVALNLTKKRSASDSRCDRLDYSGDVATSTADITTFKILINITLTTDYADMIMMDIKKILYGHSFSLV